ncbi:hypothetical protein J2Q11_12375 [Tenacibaculum finnmarkense genomovar finnmarkense]|nr:hypothetical protein [Tenacibaculum finnmarkense]MCG8213579.1 hypothetical protein [Tenacibaculum finnmarkense genomovar finnmarkense]MCG8231926.1 hypothetical protein [Tenacibaculum finnmarkense genomovar finnmarkense]MCG8886460.1 hypothetical protein [Tenacibaculum finnmarkense]MCG8897242.1 hypothetical protein [Tenacibaculum finnmarkense]MCG8903980.1 hypothetical protein [Tenacibaculum finnmarkense]
MELKILDSLSVAVSELKEVTSEIKKIRTGLNVLYQKGDKVTFGNREAIVILCDGNFADIEFIGSNTIYEGVDISFLEPN